MKKQKGSILIFAVLILGSILTIALTLGAIFIPKIRLITEAGEGSVKAIFAADSGLEWCIYVNRHPGEMPPAQPVMGNGSSYILDPTNCAGGPLNNRSTGTARGVSRSLEVNEQ